MDCLPDDIFTGRSDFVGGIDNEALDFSQLEDFINDENENGNAYFVDTLGSNENNRNQNGGTTVVVVETQSEDNASPHVLGRTRLTLQSSCVITSTTFTQAHSLPESPPDSGSEPPYSPQQEAGSHSPHLKPNGTNGLNHHQEILLHPSHNSLYPHPHVGLKPPHPHPLPPTHVQCEPMLIQHPVLTPLLSTNNNSLLNNTNNRNESTILLDSEGRNQNIVSNNRDAILLSRNDTAILLNSDTNILSHDSRLSESPLLNRSQLLNASSPLLNSNILNSSIGSPVLLSQNGNNNITLSQHPQPSSSPSLGNNGNGGGSGPSSSSSQSSNLTVDSGLPTLYSSLQGGAKKRKLSQDLSTNSSKTPFLYVKQEKQEPGIDLSPDSNSSQPGLLDDDYNLDGSVYMDSSYQCIRFQPFQQTQWHVLCDQNLKELPVPHYRVDADKGFNFSNADDAFVCQKKNHFQITCHTQLQGDAQFVKTPEGLKKISSFYLHFYGVKVESPSQTIKVEQSQSDRSKKPFHPVLVELQGEQVTKVTVGRLHFSETTSNNMRKKGKPNPDQRYFYLVVGLHAHTSDSNYQIVSHASERIIVRASNPGQFESDVELCWQKGHTSESIYHAGRVGINTDRPDESLVVHGNLKVTGHIVQPSDVRAKCQVEECNTKEQLKNIEQIRVVKYKYATEFADQVGIKEDTGVIAQEVREILPDAVSPGGNIILPNGDIIENFLVVNKERIFMENIGAVKELCKVTDHLGKRIEQVEKMNRKLAKLKRIESFKSNTSASTVASKIAPTFPLSSKTMVEGEFKLKRKLFTNKLIHCAMAALILIMTFCLISIATLYFVEYQQRSRSALANINRLDVGQAPSAPTTLSSTSNHNRTNHSTIYTKPNYTKDKDRTRTTKLSPTSPRYRTKQESDKFDIDLNPSMIPKSPPVLGRPPECLSSIYGDSITCPTYCCLSENEAVENVGSPSYDSLKYNSPLVDDTSHSPPSNFIHSSKNFNTDSEATVDTKKKNNFVKDTTWIKGDKINKKTLDQKNIHDELNTKVVSEEVIIRHKRDPDDWSEIYNSNVENSSDTDGNGISISVRSTYVNQTLGSDFCAFENSYYHHCIDRTAYNFTYKVPLSRYLPDDSLTVHFQFHRQRYQIAEPCPTRAVSADCTWSKKPTVWTDVSDSTNQFTIDISSFQHIMLKYRIPLFQAVTKMCELPSSKVGFVFVEYNLHFYRECDE